jgi:hypothetical protein
METRGQIRLGIVRRIGAMHHRADSIFTSRAGHPECQFAVSRETHFGKEIEIVLANDNKGGLVAIQCGAKALLRRVEGRIEKGDAETSLLQHRGRQDRL